jgi:hypothetical protein
VSGYDVAQGIQMRYAIAQGYESELPKIEFEKIRVAGKIIAKFVLK